MPYRGRDRRDSGPVEERVTRLEEQFGAFQAEMRGQAIRDGDMHRDIFRLIEKQDSRMDREHDERVQLSSDIRSLVNSVASDVRNVATKIAVIGGALVIAANIIGPIIAPLIVRAIP